MKTYVLWKEQNNYKLQRMEEYIANVCDARKIWTLRDFNTAPMVKNPFGHLQRGD